VTRRPRLLLPVAAGLLVLAALAFAILAGSGGNGQGSGSQGSSGAAGAFDGAALPAGVPAPLFTLSDQDGRALSLGALRGREVLIAFPYTTCRNSCVVIAQQIRGALDELSKQPAVLLVSADPAADTPANVGRFLERVSLTGRASYLTGTAAELRRVWHEYHVTPASAGPSCCWTAGGTSGSSTDPNS
jgi:cytochrome oxidase Cu insertion factor (SCO1/SenC/PrrC family)